MKLSIEQLREFLEEKYRQYNRAEFIETDPISIPHLFTKKEDREIIGFLTATLAWGQRPTILRKARQLVMWMDNDPHAFILSFTTKDLKPFQSFIHRTFNGIDTVFFLKSLQRIYRDYRDLEEVFVNGIQHYPHSLGHVIHHFRNEFFSIKHPQRTEKHIADPLRNSSAKRICMFLRWMVRKDNSGVDFGIWEKISPACLQPPLDLHSGATARNLGLLIRKQNDWKAVEELGNNLRILDPNDPVKYDFALYGLGVFEGFNKQ
ncbi:MAG: TIGR02757 family protein [Flavobacteriales bacterium]|nr:TIGR02757 family protein [Flavobacteriales bacterium]